MKRRSFLGYAVGMVSAAVASAQTAILENGKAVVCESSTIKCPLNHESCRRIDAPIAVGNDNRNYPSVGQVYDYHVFVCDRCGVIFAVKQ